MATALNTIAENDFIDSATPLTISLAWFGLIETFGLITFGKLKI